jgi:exonuclease SbcC
MIKSLHIKNFQSHKDTFVEFDPNVTAIIGLNNHGKSAILKALRKIVRNLPLGDSFIRELPEDSKLCSIVVKSFIEDLGETTVFRVIERNGENSYKVLLPSKEEYFFNKFSKTGIPDEVVHSLGVSPPILLDDNLEIDLNFHVQKDEDFLIRGKGLASIRNKIIGKITGIDIVQKAFQVVKTKEKKIESEISTFKKRKEDLDKRLLNYEDLDSILIEMDSIKNQVIEYRNKEDFLNYLNKSLNDLNLLITKAVSVKRIVDLIVIPFDISVLQNKTFILTLLRKLSSISYNLSSTNLVLSVLDTTKTLNADHLSFLFYKKNLLEKQLKLFNRIQSLHLIYSLDFTSLKSSLDRVETIYKNISFLKEKKKHFDYLFNNIEEKEKQIEDIKVLIEKEVQCLQKIKEELKICPICNRPF